MKRLVFPILLFCLVVSYSFYFLNPAGGLLLRSSRDVVMTDGTEASAISFQYQIIKDTVRTHPSRLFYGTVYTDKINPPEGFRILMPWNERIAAAIFSLFVPVEQVVVAFVMLLLVANAFSMYAFGRLLGWSQIISTLIAMCWTFTPYTRARAVIHPGFAGNYFLPLAFAAALLIAKKPRARNFLLGGGLLALCFTSAHYYWIILTCVTPLLILFWYYEQDTSNKVSKKGLLVALSIPISFLIWNAAFKVPSQYRQHLDRPLLSAKLADQSPVVMGAKPIDYLVSDLSFSGADWNPLREYVNDFVLHYDTVGNPHERTNGIRWTLLGLALAGIIWAFQKKETGSVARRRILIFGLLSVLGFLFALPANTFELGPINLSPFHWLNKLFPPFRVPARFGVVVQFGVMTLSGIFLENIKCSDRFKIISQTKQSLIVALVALLIFAEYWPIRPIPTKALNKPWLELGSGREECGPGLLIPYLSHAFNWRMMLLYYSAQQHLRGTSCYLANRSSDDEINFKLDSLLGRSYIDSLLNNKPEQVWNNEYKSKLIKFVECSKVNWVSFATVTPEGWVKDFCKSIRFEQVNKLQCRSASEHISLKPLEQCI